MSAARPVHFSAFRILTGLILGLVAAGVLFESSHVLAVGARNAAVFDLAVSLEFGVKADWDYLSRFQDGYGLRHPDQECDDRVTRSVLTVGLATLNVAILAKEPKAIADSAQAALAAVRRRLSCNAVDGNAWARYGAALWQLKAPAPDVLAALDLSVSAAPYESWIIQARLPLETFLYTDGVTAVEPRYVRDLKLYFAFEPVEDVARNFASAEPKLQALARPLISALPEPRKSQILANIDALGVVFNPK